MNFQAMNAAMDATCKAMAKPKPKPKPKRPWYEQYTVYDFDTEHGEVLIVDGEYGGYVDLAEHINVIEALKEAEAELAELREAGKTR